MMLDEDKLAKLEEALTRPLTARELEALEAVEKAYREQAASRKEAAYREMTDKELQVASDATSGAKPPEVAVREKANAVEAVPECRVSGDWFERMHWKVEDAIDEGKKVVYLSGEDLTELLRCAKGMSPRQREKINTSLKGLEVDFEYYQRRGVLHVRPHPTADVAKVFLAFAVDCAMKALRIEESDTGGTERD